MYQHQKKKRILVLTANPKNTTRLRLGEEVRDIRTCLQDARYRDAFEFDSLWAVRPCDLQKAMFRESDTTVKIIHFSGHGEKQSGLYFENEVGEAQIIPVDALADLFALFSEKFEIECVVLNSCYSQIQAKAIAKHVPYVIGMSQAVSDRSAIKFAIGFYTAIGNGDSIDFAFRSGKNAIALDGANDSEIPVLLSGFFRERTQKDLDEKQSIVIEQSSLLRKRLDIYGEQSSLGKSLDVEVTRQINTDLKSLISYLKNKKWEKADIETYNCILSAAGRTEESWLRSKKDTEKISWELIGAIDDIWTYYSHGKFGFTPQKDILYMLNNSPPSKVKGKLFEKFQQTVGWMKDDFNSTIIEYEDFTFCLNARKGHLPTFGRNQLPYNEWTPGLKNFLYRICHFSR